jgi:hypothetical protein
MTNDQPLFMLAFFVVPQSKSRQVLLSTTYLDFAFTHMDMAGFLVAINYTGVKICSLFPVSRMFLLVDTPTVHNL